MLKLELEKTREKAEFVESQLESQKAEFESMRRDARERQARDDEHAKELDTLRREVEIRDIAIQFHD